MAMTSASKLPEHVYLGPFPDGTRSGLAEAVRSSDRHLDVLVSQQIALQDIEALRSAVERSLCNFGLPEDDTSPPAQRLSEVLSLKGKEDAHGTDSETAIAATFVKGVTELLQAETKNRPELATALRRNVGGGVSRADRVGSTVVLHARRLVGPLIPKPAGADDVEPERQ